MEGYVYARMVVSLMLLASIVGTAQAEVKNVQMKIAGYLCGN
jgi:hypothetical protein